MIPKRIHYVWVGQKKIPKHLKKCIKTWSKRLQDYEIIEWNENNFDIKSHPFVEAAYKNKKWAFVSDYIRAWVLYNYGGIYLDTDNIVLGSFDSFLNDRAFVGFENSTFPFTAAFGAEKKHPLVKDILDYYNQLNKYSFDFNDNNTIFISNILIKKYGCQLGNKEQVLKEGIHVYPDNILCNPSKDSICIHVFTGTWLNESTIIKNIVRFLKIRLTTKKRAHFYQRIIRK